MVERNWEEAKRGRGKEGQESGMGGNVGDVGGQEIEQRYVAMGDGELGVAIRKESKMPDPRGMTLTEKPHKWDR